MPDPIPTSEDLRRFLEAKRTEIHARALMSYPQPDAQELAEIAAFARLFHVLDGPIVIRHPHLDLRLELSRVLGPRIAYLIAIGDYELTDLELMSNHLEPGDRVLELGGGAGLTAALAAKRSGETVTVAEPDERVVPVIRRQVELNGGTVRFEHGVVLGPEITEPVHDFYVDDELWFSSIVPAADAFGTQRSRKPISVPVLSLHQLLERYQPTVLTIDIEGAERTLFTVPLPIHPDKIFIEIHAPLFGEKAGIDVIQAILDQGYRIDDQRSWMYVFRRKR